jgi:hypothetical protein
VREIRNAHDILIAKCEGGTGLEKHFHKWERIVRTDFEENGGPVRKIWFPQNTSDFTEQKNNYQISENAWNGSETQVFPNQGGHSYKNAAEEIPVNEP